jgi:hypothetical protein
VRRIQGEVDRQVDSTMDLQAAWIVVKREKIRRSRRTRFIFPSALLIWWSLCHGLLYIKLVLLP